MSETNEPKYERDKVYTINVSDLIPNPQQPRQHFDEDEITALAKSIETDGLLQNITFTRSDNQLIVISGERRLRACKLLEKSTIEGKYVEGDLRTLALIENIFRSDLTAVELSESVAALKDQKQCKADEIAKIIGKKKSTTSEILMIAKLPQEILDDARRKPEMTRERLLKIARRKDVAVQQKMYSKLLNHLEKPAKVAEKSPSIPADGNAGVNRVIISQVRKLNKLTEDLQAAHEKMLSKNEKSLTDEDIQLLTTAFEKMREIIETMTSKQ